MKRQLLVLLFLCGATWSFGQSKSITLTVKTTIDIVPETAKTELITVDENSKSSTKQLPHIFTNTEEHERLIQEEISKITSKGFELTNSSSLQYGGTKSKYYLITRYIFKEHGK